MRSLSKFFHLLSPGLYITMTCVALIVVFSCLFLNAFEVI